MSAVEPPLRRLSLIAAGLAVAALAGCGGTSTPKPVAAASATPTVTTSPTASPSPTAAAVPPGSTTLTGKQLLAEVMPYPSGAKKITVENSAGGVYTVATYAAAQYEDGAAGQDYLNALNFVAAARRFWSAGGSHFVEITLIELDAAGARTYMTDSYSDYTDQNPKPDQTLPLPDGLDGKYFVTHKADSGGNRGVAMIATVGNVVVEVNWGSKVALASGDVDKALALLKAQIARIK